MTWELIKGIFGNRWVQLALVAVLMGFGGYATGRWATPPKITTITKTEEKVVEKIVYKDKIMVKTVYVKEKKEDKHVETETTKKPDGTVVTKTKTDTKTDTNEKKDTDKVVEKIVYQDRVVEKKVIETKIVENKPNWRIGAGVGYAIPTALGQQQIGIEGLKGAVIQLELSRRIGGPVFLDVFGTTQGTAGVGLSAVF